MVIYRKKKLVRMCLCPTICGPDCTWLLPSPHQCCSALLWLSHISRPHHPSLVLAVPCTSSHRCCLFKSLPPCISLELHLMSKESCTRMSRCMQSITPSIPQTHQYNWKTTKTNAHNPCKWGLTAHADYNKSFAPFMLLHCCYHPINLFSQLSNLNLHHNCFK